MNLIDKLENIFKKKLFKFVVLFAFMIFIFPAPWIAAAVVMAEHSFNGWVWVAIVLFIWPILFSTIIGYVTFVLFKKIQKNLGSDNISELLNNLMKDPSGESLSSSIGDSHSTINDTKIDKNDVQEAEVIEDDK